MQDSSAKVISKVQTAYESVPFSIIYETEDQNVGGEIQVDCPITVLDTKLRIFKGLPAEFHVVFLKLRRKI